MSNISLTKIHNKLLVPNERVTNKKYTFYYKLPPDSSKPLFMFPISTRLAQSSYRIKSQLPPYSVMQERFQIGNLDMTRAISLVT